MDTVTIDVTVLCTEVRDYAASLLIYNNDPCDEVVDVPIEIHCVESLDTYIYLPIVFRNY